jgi:hypothetical protein
MIRARREGGGFLAALLAGARQGFSELVFDTPQQVLDTLLAEREQRLKTIQDMQTRAASARASGKSGVAILDQQITAALQGLNELQIRIERAQGILSVESGEFFVLTPKSITKKPPPDAALKEDHAGRDPRQMTFDDLLAKNAMKREQMIQQAEDEATRNYVRDAEQRAKAEEREAAALEKLTRKYKDLIDPIEPLRRELGELDNLYAAGRLTADEYAEATFMIENKIENLNVKAKDAAKDGLPELKTAIEGWGRGVSRDLGQKPMRARR